MGSCREVNVNISTEERGNNQWTDDNYDNNIISNDNDNDNNDH